MVQYSEARRNYLRVDLSGADNNALLLKTYDAALAACHRQDVDKARQALLVLRDSLVFDRKPELAERLLHCYLKAAGLVSLKRFDEAAELLRVLRASWEEILVPSAYEAAH
ncbi:MAG: hypothetical protein ACLFUS_09960 [Candidatus Sumerlaeia bacterium]